MQRGENIEIQQRMVKILNLQILDGKRSLKFNS